MQISNFSKRQSAIIYILSFSIGLFLYFSCDECYKGWWIALEQYSTFSKHIYEPNTSYYAESILLPLLAKFFNANQTREAYNTFCGFATIAVLPLLAYGLMARLHKFHHVLLVLGLYASSFIYLKNFWLGYPDPIVMILLNFAVFFTTPLPVFLCIFLASLAHHSLSVASALCLMALYYASGSILRSARPKLITAAALGLVAGKGALLLWYFIFSYKLEDRIDFVAHGSTAGLFQGVLHFYDVYTKEIAAFWTTPGIAFIIIYTCMVLYFLLRRRFLFALALLFSVAIAYAVRFITTDGLRDFASTISAPYVFALVEFCNAFPFPTRIKT